jgi:hypothetical protein
MRRALIPLLDLPLFNTPGSADRASIANAFL